MTETQMRTFLKKIVEEPSRTPREELVEAMTELDRCQADPAQRLDPRLRHFLQGRSYHKALAYLDGSTDTESGKCSR